MEEWWNSMVMWCRRRWNTQKWWKTEWMWRKVEVKIIEGPWEKLWMVDGRPMEEHDG